MRKITTNILRKDFSGKEFSWLRILFVVLIFAACLCGIYSPDCGESTEVRNLQSPYLVQQVGHTGGILSVKLSRDGKLVVSAGQDGAVKLWAAESGKEIRTLQGHKGGVWSVDISKDALTAVSGGEDGSIRLWNLATGAEIRQLSGHSDTVSSVKFLDNDRIVSGSWDGTVRLWQASTGKEIRLFSGQKKKITSVDCTADGKYVISGGWDRTVKVWDAEKGDMVREFSLEALASLPAVADSGRSTFTVDAVAVSGDKKYLATVISGFNMKLVEGKAIQEYVLVLWDFMSGKLARVCYNYAGFSNVAFMPDNLTAIAGNGKDVVFFDCSTGKVTKRLSGHNDLVRAVAVSQGGKRIVSGGDSRDRTLRLWDPASGSVVQEFKRTLGRDMAGIGWVSFLGDGSALLVGNYIFHLFTSDVSSWLKAFEHVSGAAADGRFLFTANWNPNDTFAAPEIVQWDLKTKSRIRTINDMEYRVMGSVSRDGDYEIEKKFDRTGQRLVVKKIGSHDTLTTLEGDAALIQNSVFSFDGALIVGGGGKSRLWEDTDEVSLNVWDAKTGKIMHSLSGHIKVITNITSSPVDNIAASSGFDGTVKIWDLVSGKQLYSFSGHGKGWIDAITFSPDGASVASAGNDGTIKVWDRLNGGLKATLIGHSGHGNTLAFSPDGRLLLSGSDDEPAILWDLPTGHELCRIFVDYGETGQITWAVIDPKGRFDTNNLEEIKGLHWVMPDDPLTPLPLEVFMKDYYEPRLLPRILNHAKFNPVKDLMKLNRVLPSVAILSVTREGNGDTVTVKVEVARQSRLIGDKEKSTDVKDVKLFRDGQLVGCREGKISLEEKTGKAVLTFSGIRLPKKEGIKEIKFSAYTFNDDDVKSQTSLLAFAMPEDIKPAVGRAFIVTIGVNKYENPAWNLAYAARDAEKIRQTLEARIPKLQKYSEIVPITLVDEKATRSNIENVFALLSGKDVSAVSRDLIPNGGKLSKATPEDLLIISFSGHGYVDGKGIFYTFTHDTGAGNDKVVTPDLLDHIVSSDKLSEWLRDVDAGDMAMIVDACHSAASVEGEGFKPGPMGSRGLGQLAFDKGMKILAASQADDFALESDKLQQGLLSYSLVHDGIEARQADFKPKDKTITLSEWLEYGVERVPKLYEEVKANSIQDFGTTAASRGTVVHMNKNESSFRKKNAFQQPSLFDFTKKKSDVVLMKDQLGMDQ